jgi:hypothetical protein
MNQETENSSNKPNMTVVQNVSLEEFEKAVYLKNYESASRLMLSSLRLLKIGGEFIGYAPDARVKPILYTRFCSALTTLLLDPGFNLSQNGFDLIASEHAMIDTVYRASMFETSDHLLPVLMDKPKSAGPVKLTNGKALVKFLLSYSLRSAFSLNFQETFSKSPKETFSLWIGMLTSMIVLSKTAQARKDQLLGLGSIFESIVPPPSTWPSLSDAYMYCSYGVIRDKHDVKALIHQMMSKTVGTKNLPSRKSITQRRAERSLHKPVMIVAVEWWTSLHAMYRCYAPIVKKLRESFYIVGMSRRRDIDEVGMESFDEWQEVPELNLNLNDLIAKINNAKPDMIYYPSLGMAMWWVAMASLRLAPIQVMTLGHPASSRSLEMDYVICERGSIGDPSLFTEKIVQVAPGSGQFVMRPDAEIPEPRPFDDETEFVNIAVPAMVCKLTASFMETLVQIRAKVEETGKHCRFHFFVNMVGLTLFQAAKEIREWIKDALIYERMGYNQYMTYLNQCDVHLSTFPFGGTNSNVDSFLLKIPVVTLEGLEPHERFDAMMLRRVGLEDLVAKSKEEYVSIAVNLLTSQEYRKTTRDKLDRDLVMHEFYGQQELVNNYANAFSLVYNFHEDMIKVGEQNVFDI